MAMCEVNGPSALCACGMRYIERHASRDDLVLAYNEIVQGRAPKLILDSIAACRST
jgi:hypothetical protein